MLILPSERAYRLEKATRSNGARRVDKRSTLNGRQRTCEENRRNHKKGKGREKKQIATLGEAGGEAAAASPPLRSLSPDMAAVSSSRDQQQRLAALGVSAEGGMSKSVLPSSPLARRGVGLFASTSNNGASSFADKDPLLPTSYRDASSGDLHGHWRRVTAAQQLRVNSLGKSRSFVAGTAYCMGEPLLFFAAFQRVCRCMEFSCNIASEVLLYIRPVYVRRETIRRQLATQTAGNNRSSLSIGRAKRKTEGEKKTLASP